MCPLEIIFISMLLSTIIVFTVKSITQKILLAKKVNRFNYINNLISNKSISQVYIDINVDKHRIKDTPNHDGIIIDDVIYTDKNSYFAVMNNNIYVIGRKKEFCITLITSRTNAL